MDDSERDLEGTIQEGDMIKVSLNLPAALYSLMVEDMKRLGFTRRQKNAYIRLLIAKNNALMDPNLKEYIKGIVREVLKEQKQD